MGYCAGIEGFFFLVDFQPLHLFLFFKVVFPSDDLFLLYDTFSGINGVRILDDDASFAMLYSALRVDRY